MFLTVNIKKIRKLLNLSLEEFAIDMDVNTAMQRKYENGSLTPDTKYIKRLAASVSLKPDDLLYAELTFTGLFTKVPAYFYKTQRNTSETDLLQVENSSLKQMVKEQEVIIKKLQQQIEKLNPTLRPVKKAF